MKILYCINSLYNPGGMERVLLNRVSWLSKNTDWEIIIATTDQKGRPPFYPVPLNVQVIDLGINYSDDNGKPFFLKFLGYFFRRHSHKLLLSELVFSIRPDIVDCFYPGECSFVPRFHDGSKKIIELHQSKLFHYQYNRRGLMGWADKFRAQLDERMVRRFDRFVVLTQEDAEMWGNLNNIVVIPNAALASTSGLLSDCSAKRVIAVGRLDYQKGFDRLIEAWRIVHMIEPEWRLDIFGQGEWREMLQDMIDSSGLHESVSLNKPTEKIELEYAASSIIVMSSHFEGFPMAMIEGMAYGLPSVSFDFKCGPRDIIEHGVNGLVVPDGNIKELAMSLLYIINNPEIRKKMSVEAKKVVDKFSENHVMQQWLNCYK